MRFLWTYIRLNLRGLFRTRFYRGYAAFLATLALCMALLTPRTDAHSPYTLAVRNEAGTALGEQVISLLEADGGYLLRRCATQRELTAAVLSGEALCGYSFAPNADEQVAQGRYNDLIGSFYSEKSPAAALCDEAVYGAVYSVLAPGVAARYLEGAGLDAAGKQRLEERFAAEEGGNPMTIRLEGLDGEPSPGDSGSAVTGFLYSVICSLTLIFAITSTFYTHSIDRSLTLAGQKPLLVGLCGGLTYSISFLILLVGAHLALGAFLPELLSNPGLWGSLGLTALWGGVLEVFSRRFLTPAVIPLLPFLAVLLVGAAVVL